MSGSTSTTARPSAHARLDALDGRLDRLEGLVEQVATSVHALVSGTTATRPVVTQTAAPAPVAAAAAAPARTGRPRDAAGRFLPEGGKPATARTRTAPAAPAAPKVVTRKGEQVVGKGGLTTKEWNRTLTAKARLAGQYAPGVSVYAAVLVNWEFVQGQRKAGLTPDQVLSDSFIG